jgi:hypothetical protein
MGRHVAGRTPRTQTDYRRDFQEIVIATVSNRVILSNRLSSGASAFRRIVKRIGFVNFSFLAEDTVESCHMRSNLRRLIR